MKLIILALAAQVATDLPPGGRTVPSSTLESVTLGRPFKQPYVCGEHVGSEGGQAGDALGADCMVLEPNSPTGGSFARLYRGSGAANEDWFGWNAEVLAPFDGVVVSVEQPGPTNRPGGMGTRGGMVTFRRADGLQTLYGHVQDIKVQVGQNVSAGEVFARVGNNGRSRNPHIHVGAWKGQAAYQIRWDLRGR